MHRCAIRKALLPNSPAAASIMSASLGFTIFRTSLGSLLSCIAIKLLKYASIFFPENALQARCTMVAANSLAMRA